MATFAVTLVWPTKSGDRAPEADGLLREVWRVTGDGSTTTATLTPATIRGVVSLVGGTTLTHNVAPPSAGSVNTRSSVTLTWGTALGDGLYQDFEIKGTA